MTYRVLGRLRLGRMTKAQLPVPVLDVASLEQRIYVMRGVKVMLDADLATLYGVPTKVLNQAVRRNHDRFPADFMFELTPQEVSSLRSQIATSKEHSGRGGRRYAVLAFTEQGVAMHSSVLNSPFAIQVNIALVRTFVRMRQVFANYAEVTKKIEDLEQRYDGQFSDRSRIGFD